MGKGSGNCQRPEISLEASGTKTESELHNEIDFTLTLRRTKHCWWTKDERASYQKRKEGWVVFSFSDLVCKAFKEYGIIHQQAGANSEELTYFPSLKAAQQAVNDVSLEAGLNIDTSLTRQKYVVHNIGDLPLNIKKEESYWRVYSLPVCLSPSLKNHFNSTQEFKAAWESTGIRFTHYPTRKAAHQAVINWLAQTIAEK
jgi:hypothetical protein